MIQSTIGLAKVSEPKFLKKLQIPGRYSAAKDVICGKKLDKNRKELEPRMIGFISTKC